jgi:NTP pyrophosphatase (non-canonical NTP hydrolase)
MPNGDARDEALMVVGLSQMMVKKLRENRHKGGWRQDGPTRLLERLKAEVVELEEAVKEWQSGKMAGHPLALQAVALEAADVANFAGMVADSVGALE